jgi:hypothetical protein
VRLEIPAGSEVIDPSWTVNWLDLTEGRQGAVLRFIRVTDSGVSIFHTSACSTTRPAMRSPGSDRELANLARRSGGPQRDAAREHRSEQRRHRRRAHRQLGLRAVPTRGPRCCFDARLSNPFQLR